MRTRGGLSIAVSLGLTSLTGFAAAASAPIELSWSAPDECPERAELVHAVQEFLGESLAEAGGALTIDSTVQGEKSRGYAAKLVFSSARGTTERALTHPECDKLMQGAAFLIALAIDPERVQTRQAAAASFEPAAPSAAAPAPLAPSPPPPAPPQPRSAAATRAAVAPPASKRSPAVRASISLVGLVAAGVMPGAAPGIGADLGFRYGYFEAAVAGRAWSTRNAPVPSSPGASVDLSLMTGGLRLCGVPSHDRWAVPICTRADFGQMSGIGEGVDNSRTRGDWFGAWGGSLGVAYRVGRVSPVAGVELLRGLARPAFGVLKDGEQVEAFRPQPLQFTAFLGLAYAL